MKNLDDLTTKCIRCGFCLEACPTFVVTGNEMESPRGRIYLVRSADEGKLDWKRDVKEHLDCCLGCRACETACPSGVQYGEILEIARDIIEDEAPERTKSLLLQGTTSPGLLKTQLLLGGLLPGRKVPTLLSKMLSGHAPEADKPRAQATADLPPLDESAVPPVKGEVYMLEGCAMRVLFPRVHQATRRLLRRVGYTVREVEQGCCGALHAHNGHLEEARNLGRKLVERFSDDLPVVVNSAGCGSTMKEYGTLLGTEGSTEMAARVKDISEFLIGEGLIEELKKQDTRTLAATYHDACHLAHGQRITSQPRQLLEAVPGLTLHPLPEADMCCGSAGIYNVTQPQMARELLERKFSAIESTGAGLVVMGNPGCHAWIAQAAREHGGRINVLHTAEMLEAAFSGLEHFV